MEDKAIIDSTAAFLILGMVAFSIFKVSNFIG